MRLSFRELRSLRPWQTGVLAAVLLGAAAGAYGAYELTRRGNGTDLEGSEQLIPVQRGDLVDDVSISGSLVFPERETLSFGTTGIVADVLIEEGQQVEEGQALARLDSATIASLEEAVARARVDLERARDALVEAQEPYTALGLSQREADVANARLSLQDAQDALAALLELSDQAVAQAEAAVTSARLSVRNAEDALAALEEPSDEAVAQAEAEAAVTSAKLSVRNAEDALAVLLEPGDVTVAQAEATVTSAKLSLQDAQDALAGLLAPTDQAVAQAEAAVTGARLSLQDAQDALAALLAPSDQAVAQAETAVTSARIAVQQARDDLDAVANGPSEDDLADARSQVDSASTALANAEGDLKLTTNEWEDKLGAARESLDAAVDSYRGVFTKWLGIEIGETDRDLDPATLLAAWGADLTSLFTLRTGGFEYLRDDADTPWNELVVSAWLYLYPGTVLPTCEGIAVATEKSTILGSQTLCVKEEIDGAWDARQDAKADLDTVQIQAAKALSNAESTVAKAQDSLAGAEENLANVEAGADLLEIENRKKELALVEVALQKVEDDLAALIDGPDPFEVEAQRKQVALLEASLAEAEDALADLTDGPEPLDIENREKAIAVAQATLQISEDDLDQLLAEPDPVDIESKENDVALAQAALQKAEDDLVEVLADPDPLEVDSKEKELALAEAALQQTEDDLADLLAGPDPLEVEARRNQVALAQAALVDAEEDLADLLAGTDPLELALREAELTAAETAALGDALRRLEGAVIEAPWDGVVSLVNIEQEDTVNSNLPAIEVVDLSVVELDGLVDEIDVLFVREGAQASVTLDALTGGALRGVVSEISTTALTQQGVVTFPIRVRVDVPDGVQFREGLSAVANVVVRQELDVILIPLAAVSGTFAQPVVRVLNSNGGLDERPVTLGDSDDFWTVVESGLAEGDQIVMQSAEASAGGLSGGGGGFFRGFRGGGAERLPGAVPGGGFGGGGFGGRGGSGGGQGQQGQNE